MARPPPFLVQEADGTVRFTERSKKHAKKTIEEVALSDPKYLRWARQEHTVGQDSILEVIDRTMTRFGIPFHESKKILCSQRKVRHW